MAVVLLIIVNMSKILSCFYATSGVKVNFHREVFNIGAANIEFTRLANLLKREATCLRPSCFLFSMRFNCLSQNLANGRRAIYHLVGDSPL
ncbi:hypothetical protein HanIR_Chr04g0188341 [Helianthus annuus]|nr:hypothetical protein HanIR_Chr04g0188341 [Helianthus annuus]